MRKILIIEDEIKINTMIADFFTFKGFNVVKAFDGVEGINIFYQQKDIDLIILDIMIPGIDGFSVLENIRKNSNIPIIMVTARGGHDDVMRGYQLKVDDYIIKPFNLEVLVAKVEVVLNRVKSVEVNEQNQEYQMSMIKGIKLDRLRCKVYIDEEEIQLERKQFELLQYLMENKNIVISRENLLDSLWGIDYFGNIRVVDAQIKKLRKNLKHKAYLVKTVFGIGYKFDEE